ncbi:TATA box-binding protein-associated factor RNA polymerase I subunit B [Eutrema salsugineum]|nr:TATA box-binding protein-associated factor RNA polymerase I subunit B [Eutrema salsugineum]
MTSEEIPMICKECENDAFSEEDGFFYCQQCGVRADDIIAIAVDDDDLVGKGEDTRGATYQPIHTRRRPPSHVTNPSQLRFEDYYKQVRDRYVNGFLMMITFQCDALVEKFNVTPLIIGLVGPICLRLVALSGVFDDGWADKAVHDSERRSQGEVRCVKRRNGDKGEPRSFDGKRLVTIWVNQLRKSLPLSSSLAISFLACHKAGAPILPTDIVRWAREGKVPYLSCFLRIQEKMGKRSADCPVEASVMFRPFEVVSAQRLEARAALIVDVIGLPLPPVNLYGIASNYLKRLCISEEKVLDLVSLIRSWSMPSGLYLSKNELRLPTRVCVMSIVIVAVRMIYNINGFGVWERSLGVDICNEADVVSDENDEEVSETKTVAEASEEFDTEELLKNLEANYDVAAESVEYEKDLLSYLSHGKNEVFAGLVEAAADDTYRTVDSLWKGYTKDEVKSCILYGTEKISSKFEYKPFG